MKFQYHVTDHQNFEDSDSPLHHPVKLVSRQTNRSLFTPPFKYKRSHSAELIGRVASVCGLCTGYCAATLGSAFNVLLSTPHLRRHNHNISSPTNCILHLHSLHIFLYLLLSAKIFQAHGTSQLFRQRRPKWLRATIAAYTQHMLVRLAATPIVRDRFISISSCRCRADSQDTRTDRFSESQAGGYHDSTSTSANTLGYGALDFRTQGLQNTTKTQGSHQQSNSLAPMSPILGHGTGVQTSTQSAADIFDGSMYPALIKLLLTQPLPPNLLALDSSGPGPAPFDGHPGLSNSNIYGPQPNANFNRSSTG